MTESKRGGRRAGAGRPVSDDGARPRTVAFRLTEAEYEALLEAAHKVPAGVKGKGESAGEAARRLLRGALGVQPDPG